MNSKKTIDTIVKISEVFCRVVYICSIVCLCISAVGFVLIPYGGEILKIGGVTINNIIDVEDTTSLFPFFAEGIINCIGFIILTREAQRYLRLEIQAGTPFDLEAASELKRLGLITVIVPISANIIVEIVSNIFESITNSAAFSLDNLDFDNDGSIAIGLMLVLMSVLCRYGAESRASLRSQ